jgi:hypothetical protein
MENRRGKFPWYGKNFFEISMPWKNFFGNFHAMEIFSRSGRGGGHRARGAA